MGKANAGNDRRALLTAPRRRLAAPRATALGLTLLFVLLCPSLPAPAAQAAATGAWLEPARLAAAELSDPAYVFAPDVAVDAAGDAYAVWLNYEATSGTSALQVATRAAGAQWSAPIDLVRGALQNPRITADSGGNAVVVWEGYSSGMVRPDEGGVGVRADQAGWSAYAADRRSEGQSGDVRDGWSEPRQLAGPSDQNLYPVVAVSGGEATAVWELFDGTRSVVQAAAWSVRPGAPSGEWTSPPGRLSGADPSSGQPRPAHGAQVTADGQGNAYAAWIESDASADVVMATERPKGGTWSGPASRLSPAASNTQARLAAGAEGTVAAIWLNGSVEPPRVEGLVKRPGQAWPAPGSAELVGGGARDLHVAVDGQGNSYAVWWGQDQGGERVSGASRPANGKWQSQLLSPVGEDALNPAVAASGDGRAVAIWESGPSGAPGPTRLRWIQAATIEIGGSWQGPVAVSDTQPADNLYPRVAMDREGNAFAAWERCLADCEGVDPQGQPVIPTRVSEWSALDGAGPRLDALSIPSAGRVGEPLSFAAWPVDVWSKVANISWAFGDGGGAAGAAVNHTFAGPGDYPVRVTATDEYGNSATQTRTVSLTAAPPPPSPPGEPPPAVPPLVAPQPATPGGGGAAPSGGQAPPVLVFDAPVAVAGGAVAPVRIGCGADLPQGCTGTLSLQTARPVKTGRGGARHTMTLGKSRFSIAAGESGTVRVRLSGPGRRLLARLKKLRVQVVVTLAGGVSPDTVAQTIMLRSK